MRHCAARLPVLIACVRRRKETVPVAFDQCCGLGAGQLRVILEDSYPVFLASVPDPVFLFSNKEWQKSFFEI
jgi:hypothetical protein